LKISSFSAEEDKRVMQSRKKKSFFTENAQNENEIKQRFLHKNK